MVIKNYKDNAELRKSFNELAERTFGINFEDWYQNGFWSDKYNPCSIVLDGKVIANVSVNHMNFIRHGKREFYIQLGTVMTVEIMDISGRLWTKSKKIMGKRQMAFSCSLTTA